MGGEEIISICIGQAGIQTGTSVWELFGKEHDIDYNGVVNPKSDIDQSPNIMYFETSLGTWVPRCIFIDTNPDCINFIKKSVQSNLYNFENMISGTEDSSNCWARGRYSVGRAVTFPACERIRKIVEKCDGPQGYLKFYNVGGGTGGGVGSAIQDKLEDNLFSQKIVNLGVNMLPSPKLSQSIVDPHNTLLSTVHLTLRNHVSILYDNEALYYLCLNLLRVPLPNYTDINQIIAQTISFLTQSMRYECFASMNLHEFATNMVPFPEFNTVQCALAPLTSVHDSLKSQPTTESITNNIINGTHQMTSCSPGSYFATSICYRGDHSQHAINQSLSKFKLHNRRKFAEWSPANFKISYVNQPMVTIENSIIPASIRSACAFINSNSCFRLLKSQQIKSQQMWPAFSCWYTDGGMFMELYNEAIDKMKTLDTMYEEHTNESNLDEHELDVKEIKTFKLMENASRGQLWVRPDPESSKERANMLRKLKGVELQFYKESEEILMKLHQDKISKYSAYNLYHYVENWEENETVLTLLKINEMKHAASAPLLAEDVKHLYRTQQGEPNFELVNATMEFLKLFTVPE